VLKTNDARARKPDNNKKIINQEQSNPEAIEALMRQYQYLTQGKDSYYQRMVLIIQKYYNSQPLLPEEVIAIDI
jgi:hypothetical protein